MLKFIKNIFRTSTPEELAAKPGSGVIHDDDFGYICYIPPAKGEKWGMWQMYGEWEYPDLNAKIGCGQIPGDENGPFKESRIFLLNKRNEITAIWALCREALEEEMKNFHPKYDGLNPEEVYYLSSLFLENHETEEWEVSFEAKDDSFWTFVSFQIKNNEIIGNTVDT